MKPCKVKFVKAIIDQHEWQQPMQIIRMFTSSGHKKQ